MIQTIERMDNCGKGCNINLDEMSMDENYELLNQAI